MSLNEHWRLVSDLGTVARTLTRANGIATGYRHDFTSGEIERDVGRLHGVGIPARIASIRSETPTVKTFRLVAQQGALPSFLPGQYVNLALTIDGTPTSRALSISSLPGEQGIGVTVKRKPDGFVSRYLLDRAQLGDEVLLNGPAGDFHFNPLRDSEDLVFVAAGSGIVPFVGMLEHLLATRPSLRALLLYGSRREEEIIFRDRIERLRWEHPDRFEVVHTLTQPSRQWLGVRGRIDAALLRRELGGRSLAGKTFFLCGPNGMAAMARAELQRLGAPGRRVRVESFGDTTAEVGESRDSHEPDERPPVTVQLGQGGERIPARLDESLMVALERAGYPQPASCRTGACASCRCRVLAGEVRVTAGAQLRQTDRDAGFVHTCATFPRGDVVLDVRGGA